MRIDRAIIGLSAAVLVLAAPAAAQQQPSPVQQAPRVITLEEALGLALERNPTLQIAENTAELDALSVRQEKGQFLPDFRLNSSTAQRYGRNFNQDEGRIINETTNSLNAGVSSSMIIFDGFSNQASLQQARFGQEASEQAVFRARQTVVFTVLSNYLTLIAQQEQLRVQLENQRAQEAQEAQIKAYVDAGARPISDLYQQQAATASSRLARVRAERGLELARMSLVRTLRLEPLGEYEFVAPELGEAPASVPVVDLVRLSQQALSQRPDLSAAEARLSAAEQGVRVASASKWPTLALTAGYSSAYTSAADIGVYDQFDQRRGGSLGFNVSLPVFDRYATRTARARARIQVENARINLENLRQEVALEVRTAHLDLRASQEQLTQAEAQLRAAELALQASQERYDVGAANIVELSVSRAALVQAQSDLVSARYGLLFQNRLMEYHLGNLSSAEAARP